MATAIEIVRTEDCIQMTVRTKPKTKRPIKKMHVVRPTTGKLPIFVRDAIPIRILKTMNVLGSGNVANFVSGGINGELARQIEFLGFYLGGPMIYFYIRSLFPDDLPIWWGRFYMAICSILSLVVILTPMRIFSETLILPQVLARIQLLDVRP